MAKRGLGKGLNELLSSALGGDDVAIEERLSSSQVAKPQNMISISRLPVEAMQTGPFQPRSAMLPETIEQLAESIKRQGVLQPIVVRKAGNHYQIIAGERRWRAAQSAGLSHIPAIIRDVSDDEAMAIGLVENIQREDLNPIDTAKGLQRLAAQMDLTHQQVAEAVGKSRTTVTNLLRLLTLNEDVQVMLENGELETGHAKALLAIKGPMQSQMARMVIKRALSVRETERIVQRLQDTAAKNRSQGVVDPNIGRLERDLTDKLGASVNIRHSTKGKGSVVIHYNDTQELEGILDRIR